MAPIEHTFVLRNGGKVPVTLDHLQPSCGCTSAVVGSGEASPKGVLLAPGQQIQVHTSVDPKRLSPGLVDKFVAVFVEGQPNPAITLEITGTLQGGVTFSRNVLDFGAVRAGSQTPLPLTVNLDMPLLPAGTKPRLVSSNPDVVLERQPDVPGDTGGAITLLQSYAVRLAPHPSLGTLTGMLSVVSGDEPNVQLLSPVTVPILGEVTGDVTASPAAFAFGMIPSGLGAAQRVELTAAARTDWQGLKITCASRFIKTRLVTASGLKSAGAASCPSPGTARAFLEVRLDPRTPVGTLETRLVVTTPTGERLILPVYAYVVHAEHLQ